MTWSGISSPGHVGAILLRRFDSEGRHAIIALKQFFFIVTMLKLLIPVRTLDAKLSKSNQKSAVITSSRMAKGDIVEAQAHHRIFGPWRTRAASWTGRRTCTRARGLGLGCSPRIWLRSDPPGSCRQSCRFVLEAVAAGRPSRLSRAGPSSRWST